MNNSADQKDLVVEVFAEASPPDFRAAMLAETLRLARRRRQFRQARRAAGITVAISLLAVLAAQRFSKPASISTPLAKQIAKPSCEMVRTQPLPANAIVHTRSFPATGFVSPGPSVTEVTTTGGGFRLINDDELLALLADKPAVLIRTGPHSEELVFANPEDQKVFPAN